MVAAAKSVAYSCGLIPSALCGCAFGGVLTLWRCHASSSYHYPAFPPHLSPLPLIPQRSSPSSPPFSRLPGPCGRHWLHCEPHAGVRLAVAQGRCTAAAHALHRAQGKVKGGEGRGGEGRGGKGRRGNRAVPSRKTFATPGSCLLACLRAELRR